MNNRTPEFLEHLRLSTAGPIARHINKRISIPISVHLARLKISPNVITLCNMILGLATGLLIARGTYLWMLAGGLLFQIVSILDGCDGEVAKLSDRESRFGQIFDTLSDTSSLFSFYVGLFFAYANNFGTQGTPWLAFLFALGLICFFFHLLVFVVKKGGSGSFTVFDKKYLQKLDLPTSSFLFQVIDHGKIWMRKDVFSFGFFIMSLLGILHWAIYFGIFFTWAATILLTGVKMAPWLGPRPSSSTSTEPSSIRWEA